MPTRPPARVFMPDHLSSHGVVLMTLDIGSRVAGAEPCIGWTVGSQPVVVSMPSELSALVQHACGLLGQCKPVVVQSTSPRLTTTEAAAVLGVSRPTVVKLLEDGRIPFERVGSHRKIRAEDLADFQRVPVPKAGNAVRFGF